MSEQKEGEAAMRWHELKTDPDVFDAVAAGRKTFEIRLDDRGYGEGDGLYLRRTRHTGRTMSVGMPLEYTGEEYRCVVTYVLRGPVYGLADGWAILSIAASPSPAAQKEGEAVPAGAAPCVTPSRNNCATCDYKKHQDGGHCYMFRTEPEDVCMKHTDRKAGEGVCLTCAANHYCQKHNPAPHGVAPCAAPSKPMPFDEAAVLTLDARYSLSQFAPRGKASVIEFAREVLAAHGMALGAAPERVKVGELLLPGISGEEYDEPELVTRMNVLEQLQERLVRDGKDRVLDLFVEVRADGVGGTDGR
jgi:hypothetical protein